LHPLIPYKHILENEIINIKTYFDKDKDKDKSILEKFDLFEQYQITLQKNIELDIKKLDSFLEDNYKSIDNKYNDMKKIFGEYSTEFADVKKNINNEYGTNIDSDEFIDLSKNKEILEKKIQQDKENVKLEEKFKNDFAKKIEEKNELLKKIYQEYKEKINDINSKQEKLELKIFFKQNKEDFYNSIKTFSEGCRFNHEDLKNISTTFDDFMDILIDYTNNNFNKIKKILSAQKVLNLEDKINKKYKKIIDYQTPNLIEINYENKPLKQYSIGQRTSAIILLILSHTNNDLLIIDQPEDDLDNETIFNNIIKNIKKQKIYTQFIFATHNANIPVLGDAEQVIAINQLDNVSKIITGGIDNSKIQNKIISIMEGGRAAFALRNKIYTTWNSM